MCKVRWVSKSHFLVFCDEESGLPRVLLGRKIGTWEGTPEVDKIYAEEERVMLFLVKFSNGRYGAVLLDGGEEEAQLLSKL